jgi:signal peptidase II
MALDLRECNDTPSKEKSNVLEVRPMQTPGVAPVKKSDFAGRSMFFFAIATFGAAMDLITKQWVFAERGLPGENPPWWLVQDMVGIETAVNIGALFGMGAGFGWFFAGAAIFAGIAILIWLFHFRAAESLWLTIALGCVMGGIIGNLYDRLGLWYKPGMQPEWKSGVRDWILLRYGEYTWPNFNIADSLLVCGAIMLAWHSFSTPARSTSSPAA